MEKEPIFQTSPKETFDKNLLLNDASTDVGMSLMEGLPLDDAEAKEIVDSYDHLLQLMKLQGESEVHLAEGSFVRGVMKIDGHNISFGSKTVGEAKVYDINDQNGASFTLVDGELRAEKNSGELRGTVRKHLQSLINSLQ
ncbi:hypothetical protein JKY72_06735 [Candidatus Gracilibacteria bacterium]|nr:hypothetical protein [Candidatus Gracilibacteria bacterium]